MPAQAPRWFDRELLSASKFNETQDLVNHLARAPGGGTSRTGQQKPVAMLVQLEVLSIDNAARTMSCTTPGASLETDKVTYEVSLQPIFNETSRNSIAYVYTGLNTRTADGTESQQITPPFVIGESIYCIHDLLSNKMLFLGDGRMWAEV